MATSLWWVSLQSSSESLGKPAPYPGPWNLTLYLKPSSWGLVGNIVVERV